MCTTGVGVGEAEAGSFHLRKQFLEGIEVIHLGMESSGRDILQGTGQEFDSMKNVIFRGNYRMGDVGVAEFDCVGVEGGLGVFIK